MHVRANQYRGWSLSQEGDWHQLCLYPIKCVSSLSLIIDQMLGKKTILIGQIGGRNQRKVLSKLEIDDIQYFRSSMGAEFAIIDTAELYKLSDNYEIFFCDCNEHVEQAALENYPFGNIIDDQVFPHEGEMKVILPFLTAVGSSISCFYYDNWDLTTLVKDRRQMLEIFGSHLGLRGKERHRQIKSDVDFDVLGKLLSKCSDFYSIPEGSLQVDSGEISFEVFTDVDSRGANCSSRSVKIKDRLTKIGDLIHCKTPDRLRDVPIYKNPVASLSCFLMLVAILAVIIGVVYGIY